MNDVVEIHGLRALGVHGVLPHEQSAPQPFEIGLSLEADLAPAAASDDLADTVDYGAVVDKIVYLVETERFALLETLAANVADATLAVDVRITAVTVSVRKLRPPLAADLSSVGVQIRRVRAERTGSDPPSP